MLIVFAQFVFLVVLVAVTSAAPTNSNKKVANKLSYYETPIIYEDVIEEKILEVQFKQQLRRQC